MKGNNVIDLHPIPSGMNISPAAWIATAPVMRDEIIRMWQELSAGEAIAKDRRCGRKKPHRKPAEALGDSFYALHLLEMDIWRFPTNTVKIAKADAMRAVLAPDVERMAQMDDLQEYHEMAAAGGTDLATVLRRYTDMEHLLKVDPLAGICEICKNIGVEPIDMFKKVHAA
jgi:hypothetical protein